MIEFSGKCTDYQCIRIEEAELPNDWKDFDGDKKLNYLISNYSKDIFSMFVNDLEVDFDFTEYNKEDNE